VSGIELYPISLSIRQRAYSFEQVLIYRMRSQFICTDLYLVRLGATKPTASPNVVIHLEVSTLQAIVYTSPEYEKHLLQAGQRRV
jgi:hypothetical protein